MPIISDKEPQKAQSCPNFFKNLTELDEWASKIKYQGGLDGLVGYVPRSKLNADSHETRGKLLVCHDYKGGYTESPSSLAYTFNFWNQCDTFIYFSHQRVTIPPPGWVNAAHRQGVKILGVLIFEHQESAEDSLRLLLGKLPRSQTSSQGISRSNGLPISRHYARLLANLARERGFDGYLLNFEFPFPGRSEQARAIEAWISLLNTELKSIVGDHAETIWYDSIITTGDLRWQDSLNSRNLSFFLPSDAFFTNYTWPKFLPSSSAQYFFSLEEELLQGSRKSLRDIYIGIDVWGRGSHGGGGLGAFRAAEHIDPMGLGLSVALFGPAWSWENDEGSEGWSWTKWWERERTLWVGPAIKGAHVEVPDAPLREGEAPCLEHGKFRPLGDFFEGAPPPQPDLLPFFTSFCPGAGYAWFVEGRRKMRKESGWTDIDKQTSLGDLLWPRPIVEWEDAILEELLPKATTSLDFEDAFNGGSSVTVELCGEGNSDSEPSFRCFWIPLQSLALAHGGLYEAELVYKVSCNSGELDLALSVKGGVDIEIKPLSSDENESGWSRISITCKPTGESGSTTLTSIGIIVAAAFDDASIPYTIGIQLGQLSVSSKSTLQGASPFSTRLLWADCERMSEPSTSLSLTWDSCVAYTTPATIRAVDVVPEVPRPPWILDRAPAWCPHLAYTNVYAEVRSSNTTTQPSDSAIFLGTSGWGSGAYAGGGPNNFVVERDAMPVELQKAAIRFYVQGITERGKVLPWDSCMHVDFDW